MGDQWLLSDWFFLCHLSTLLGAIQLQAIYLQFRARLSLASGNVSNSGENRWWNFDSMFGHISDHAL